MRATGLTHVSIHAVDMEASLRFYVEVLGLEHVPSPDFAQRVEWLRVGDLQLHLFLSETPAPEFHHLGLDVDDFEAAYLMSDATAGCSTTRRSRPPCASSTTAFGAALPARPGGRPRRAQLARREHVDRTIVTDIRHVRGERPQSAEALSAASTRAPRDRARTNRSMLAGADGGCRFAPPCSSQMHPCCGPSG